jgi:hypothetical protein
MNIVRTKSDTIGNIVYLVTDAVGAPIIDRSKDVCAIYEFFFNETDGAICYRVCGPIPIGRRPKKVKYFTRVSHQDDDVSWEACNGNGCQGEDMKFQLETGTLCSQFRLWKGHGDPRPVGQGDDPCGCLIFFQSLNLIPQNDRKWLKP